MAETVKDLQHWLSWIPDTAAIGIGEGGLTLYVVDDPHVPHEGRCARHVDNTVACTCWKATYYEIGGLPEEDGRT